jgi:hydrogenase/urease accessory protein HupE
MRRRRAHDRVGCPVYDGISHLALTPEDLVPALALTLLAGLRGADHGRRALFVLPAAWLFGSVFGLARQHASRRGASVLRDLGGLVAADAKLPLIVTTALAAVLGLFHGFLNGTAMSQPGLEPRASWA